MEMENYLHNLRMKDKYTRKPSLLEIVRSFDDCRDIARRCMDEHISIVSMWNKHIKEDNDVVVLMSFDPLVKRINELQRFLKLTSPILNNRIDTTKAKLYPIQELYDFKNIRRTSSRIQCSCPFHKDDSPSFVIYLQSNSCHCFSCGFNGDSIAISMKINNESFINTVRRLSQ